MAYIDALRSDETLIGRLGEPNAHMIWALGLYLEEPDLEALASESLTDGPNDKKIDFIRLDRDAKRIVFAQGCFATAEKAEAPANKASDLNTAAAWLFSGDISLVPEQLRPVIEDCRTAIEDGDITAIELIYVHNLPESINVSRELQTATTFLQKALGESAIRATSRELGRSMIEHLFAGQESHIAVKGDINCPSQMQFSEKGTKWEASIMSIPGVWLHQLFLQHGDALFSANYRGFLGITRRRRINTGIRQSAESKPGDFWAFNNGITLLTLGKRETKDGTVLTGISIINGAQTTGSIGAVDLSKYDLKGVKVLCRVIQCSDADTIADIVKYNNTQNEITTWDQYSNDPDQNRIYEEFGKLGHTYARKRTISLKGDQIGIEEVAQPLLAFRGKFQDANRSKNQIFERRPLYKLAFEGKKATHVLFVYSLGRSIDEWRIELKKKSTAGTIISIEEQQLALLRNLKFKYFFISLVGRCLETLLGRKVDLETIAFTVDVSNAKANTLLSLAALWSPVIQAILSFAVTGLTLETFSARGAEDTLLEEIAKQVNGLLYVSKTGAANPGFLHSLT
ncbi:MAG: AIPR family protein [Candidatus Sulfotelmatobacter sp.]